jgi:ribosomal protein S18 acetylase RimI-like enzyme
MLYQVEPYRALEIKVIYLDQDENVKAILDTLFPKFLDDCKAYSDHWDVISYPVLGIGQSRYVRYLTWYGLKPVGQSVVNFNIFDGISVEIFKKQHYTAPPEGYRFISWDDQYTEGVIDVLSEAFATSVDALWDPRFRSRDGIRQALEFVKTGGYGTFWPSCNTILLNDQNQAVGVCLLNVVSKDEANIPLIGLLKSERRHKLGRTLLAQTVEKCINEVLAGKLKIQKISATVATENIPAVRMYRHTGFQEHHWYTHMYEDRSDVLNRKKAGQWC